MTRSLVFFLPIMQKYYIIHKFDSLQGWGYNSYFYEIYVKRFINNNDYWLFCIGIKTVTGVSLYRLHIIRYCARNNFYEKEYWDYSTVPIISNNHTYKYNKNI